MIAEQVYQRYLDSLLAGKRLECNQIVKQLLDDNIDIQLLYTDLFQKSLYTVGDLWEHNRISVAREHLATAITESLMHLTYPVLFSAEREQAGKTAVISCAANEFHQIGGKMAADMFELNGWDAHFLGANTPVDHMLEHIQEVKPDLVGLSLSIYFNLDSLKKGIEAFRSSFSNLDILVGGQAFRWGGLDALRQYPGTEYAPSLKSLKESLAAA